MENNNGLTLIYISHVNIFNHVDYLNNLFLKLDGKVPLLFVYDGKVSNKTKLLLLKKLNGNIKTHFSNSKGKLLALAEASNKINTTHVKIHDHDDTIDPFGLKEVNYIIKSKINAKDYFFWHKAAIIDESSSFFATRTLDKEIFNKMLKDSKQVNLTTYSNPQAIYNTEALRLIFKKGIKGQQKFFNDDLLTFISQSITKHSFKIDIPFYIYHTSLGQTSSITLSKADSLFNLYENISYILDNVRLNLHNLKSNKLDYLSQVKYKARVEIKPIFGSTLQNKIVNNSSVHINNIWNKNKINSIAFVLFKESDIKFLYVMISKIKIFFPEMRKIYLLSKSKFIKKIVKSDPSIIDYINLVDVNNLKIEKSRLDNGFKNKHLLIFKSKFRNKKIFKDKNEVLFLMKIIEKIKDSENLIFINNYNFYTHNNNNDKMDLKFTLNEKQLTNYCRYIDNYYPSDFITNLMSNDFIINIKDFENISFILKKIYSNFI